MGFSKESADRVRAQALRAVSSNRAPGFQFAGYFLGFTCKRYQTDGVEFFLGTSPQCMDTNGNFSRVAVIYAADMALAAANRVFLDPNVRTATLMLRVEFTGEPARGALEISGLGSGFSPRTALPESVCAGRVMSDGREVLRMSGTWVSPPAPKGVAMAGLPWEGGGDGNTLPLLKRRELDLAEKATLRHVTRALNETQDSDLLSTMCNPDVKHLPNGATGKLPVGMHIGNRVGHVQGGFLLNAAIVTAEAAVPEHPITTGASSWFISPGQGKVISIRSTVLQSGRNVAVVRTELFAAGRKRVLEVISNHSVAAPSASGSPMPRCSP